ncbi:MAG: transposase [Weeksellaceae bacterium]
MFFYDFLNNPRINWRRIFGLFFKQVYTIIQKKSADEDSTQKGFLILDDSLMEKTGKTIELIGKVFDYSTHAYRLGMKTLTLGYSDGKSFLPMDFSIHNEPGNTGKRGLKEKDLKNQFTKQRDAKSPGYRRESEVSQDKISTSLQMINRCLNKWLKVDYVLVDTWFVCERFITGVKDIDKKLNVIGMMKSNRMVVIHEKTYKANSVPEVKRKNIHYSSKLKCHYIRLEMTCKGIEMTGYWVRMKGQNTWNLLISTDKKLTFLKAMKNYQIRWSIEVFFRDCKQNLGLQNCQSKDLDAHIATISIVFMNYLVLALKKRFEDYETLGILFRCVKEMILQQTIIQKIWIVILKLFGSVLGNFGIQWELFIRELIANQSEKHLNLYSL